MILADTSVWIQHFRQGNPHLAARLLEGLLLMHPFVAGELACGNLKNRAATLSDLRALPQATVATNDEVEHLLEHAHLWGKGLGWIDLHLLTSARLSNCGFWTLDKRLANAARDMGIK